ncbi:MAG: arginase [Thermoplasmata archaeon]
MSETPTPSRKEGFERVALLGVPSDLGANVVGSRFGPAAVRRELIPLLQASGVHFEDYGDVHVPEPGSQGDLSRKHLSEIRELCRNFLGSIECDFRECFPLVLGGDHSLTTCLVGELSFRREIGLVYFDAHGDFNTPETSPSGNVHGMVVSRISGRTLHSILDLKKTFVAERNIALVGPRDIDPEEDLLLRESDVTVFGMKALREKGIGSAIERAIAVSSEGTEGYHLSVDIDVIDPDFAPGVSTPVPGGISGDEALEAMRLLGRGPIRSADFVELNPPKDRDGRTAELAAKLIGILLENLLA